MSNDQQEVVIKKFSEEHEGLLKNFEKWISSKDLPRDMSKIKLYKYFKRFLKLKLNLNFI